MLKTHVELHDSDTGVKLRCKMRLSYTFYPNDITDYIVIQHTSNVENKALIFIIIVHKFKNC